MSIRFTLLSAHSGSIRAQKNTGLINLSECHTFGKKKKKKKVGKAPIVLFQFFPVQTGDIKACVKEPFTSF